MLFNSLSFFIFFPIVVTLYYLLPHKFRVFLLLAASIYFYASFIPKYIFVLIFLILIDYFVGIGLEKISDPRKRKIFLFISIIANVGMLLIFKYFNFFNINLAALSSFLHWNYPISILNLALPIGLSFHTFQSLSYIIEVYRKKCPAERNIFSYSLYVLFFPQMVAGPIERPQNLLPQINTEKKFSRSLTTKGLQLMLWGFFKKIVIADNAATIVNFIYGNLTHSTGLPLIIAVILFAFQIYCDFSGYTDIARGAAYVLGFKLRLNFNHPYFSQSFSEFWRRWHISLSSWFRDYVYIPLGGNRAGKIRWQVNIMATFLLSGLWHGANWTFVVWGALNGIFIILGTWLGKIRILSLTPKFAKILLTFILASTAFVFFRAKDLGQAFYILGHLFDGSRSWFNWNFLTTKILSVETLGGNITFLAEIFIFIFILLSVEYIQEKKYPQNFLARIPSWQRLLIYYTLIILIFCFGSFGEKPFIYFQF